MNQDNSRSVPADVQRLGGKSWTAYVRVVIFGLVALLLVTPVMFSLSPIIGSIALLASVALAVYQVMLLRSYQLYFDDIGVWVYLGVFPWNRGASGVKWRDLDEATYFQSMGSWLFKSYSIRIGHRFTKSSEILLTHWRRGHEAVMTINDEHQKLVRAGSLS